MMKTMTATTPPITAWSTPEEVDIAVVSEKQTERQVDSQSCAERTIRMTTDVLTILTRQNQRKV